MTIVPFHNAGDFDYVATDRRLGEKLRGWIQGSLESSVQEVEY